MNPKVLTSVSIDGAFHNVHQRSLWAGHVRLWSHAVPSRVVRKSLDRAPVPATLIRTLSSRTHLELTASGTFSLTGVRQQHLGADRWSFVAHCLSARPGTAHMVRNKTGASTETPSQPACAAAGPCRRSRASSRCWTAWSLWNSAGRMTGTVRQTLWVGKTLRHR